MQGLFLMVAGLLWPRLAFSLPTSRKATWLAIYGCYAAWLANLLGAIVAAGNTMVPIAAGRAHGTLLQERVIAVMLISAAIALIATAVLILYGLRAQPTEEPARELGAVR